jgi:geranylgeranyl pyrophosphate synthase
MTTNAEPVNIEDLIELSKSIIKGILEAIKKVPLKERCKYGAPTATLLRALLEAKNSERQDEPETLEEIERAINSLETTNGYQKAELIARKEKAKRDSNS